jgi:type IV secretion system protein VirB9
MKSLKFLLVATATLGAAQAAAAPALADPRIRSVAYDPSAVVRLDGCFGYQTLVQFGPGEAIENIGIGDAAQWLVTPNRRGDLLFVKPAYRGTRGNMTVSTNRRTYAFELSAQPNAACARGEVVYTLRFTYPKDEAAAAEAALAPAAAPATPDDALPAPVARNAAYSFAGARDNVPVRVFDDGRSTYFRWAEGATTPAVYAVGSDKVETMIAFTSQGDWLVAPQIAPTFVLRRGNAVATLFNDAYQAPALDAASPKPRPEAAAKRTWLARVFARNDAHAQ